MMLPKGITGFYVKNETPPSVDGLQFKQLCSLFMNANGGSVLSVTPPQFTNFFNAEVTYQNKKLHILLNAHYPYVAFAANVDFHQITFIDQPQLAGLFNAYYQILSTEELNKQHILKDSKLDSSELSQIAYWKPERIGDIIFNCWD
jgi:hypothetical protein